uniref:Uncharacterized protein n=1 Tax=Quercus lobata TaxID=97700 RepID=A0A7N2L2Z6_QUELO
MQLGQSLYNQPGAPGAGPGLAPAPSSEFGPSESLGKGPEKDVIDADFTDSNMQTTCSLFQFYATTIYNIQN